MHKIGQRVRIAHHPKHYTTTSGLYVDPSLRGKLGEVRHINAAGRIGVYFENPDDDMRWNLHSLGERCPSQTGRWFDPVDVLTNVEPDGFKVGDHVFKDVDAAIAYATSLKKIVQIEPVFK